MKTVKDILNLLRENLQSDNEDLANHAETLTGPRTRGSTTERQLSALPEDRAIVLVDHPDISPGCVCYRVEANELKPKLGAVPLSFALKRGLPVSMQQGEHGPELAAPSSDLPLKLVSHISVIVGEFAGVPAIFTWHPGDPLAAFDENASEFSANTGVKLIEV